MKKLVLGAGTSQRIEGATHQDILALEGIDLVFDLNAERWPIEDDSFDSIVACHVLEHLTDFIHFHNECHRILKMGGTLYVETPCAGLNVDLEFADPTHKRCYVPHSWINYLTIEGVDKFRYTEKCWGNLHIQIKDDCLIVHAMPIKQDNQKLIRQLFAGKVSEIIGTEKTTQLLTESINELKGKPC